jgi:hypothetical protein
MANVQVLFKSVQDEDQAPLAGSTVFVDGAPVGTTDNQGLLSVSIKEGAHGITVKAAGRQPAVDTITATEGSRFGYALERVTTATGNVTVRVKVTSLPDSAFIPITAVGPDQVDGQTDGDGLAELSLQVDNDYIIAAVGTTSSGSVSIHTVSGGQEAVIQLVIASDPAASQQGAPPPVVAPQVVEVSDLDDPEYIYPNSINGTYFTTTQARLYVGNVFLDEVNYVQFVLQDNKVPVYGYRSRYYDALAQGKSLVQGQLGINFVSEGYIRTLLLEYQRLQLNNVDKDELSDLYSMDKKISVVQAQLSDPNADRATLQPILVELLGARGDILDDLPPEAVDKLKTRRQLRGDFTVDDAYTNPLYENILFDLEVELEGANRTIKRRLEKCSLITNEQVYDQSGNPLTDGYGFIARRLR